MIIQAAQCVKYSMINDAVYNGTNEPDNISFWDKGIMMSNYPGYEHVKLLVHHRDLKHLMTPQHLIEFNLNDVEYSQRNPLSNKYNEADISYPVFLRHDPTKQYKYLVMDGHTRVNKALHQGLTTLTGYLFPYDKLNELIPS